MKNLLFFASDFKIGLSALLTDQLIALKNAGINVVAIAGENEQEKGLNDLLKEKKVNIIRIQGLDNHNDFKRLVSEISTIVKEYKIDLIHVQNNWQLALAGAIKTKTLFKKTPKIIYTLHGFRNNHPIKAKIAQAVIGTGLFVLADHVICMTQYLKKKFNLLSYKIKIIPLGVKESYFEKSFTAPRTDGLHLIFPAQFREGKNQDLIIKAFANFISQSRDSKSTLTLPGNGDLIDKMKDLVKDLGIESRVSFPGFVSKDEIKKMYLDSNIAIVASNSETFGQSIVEPYVLGRCIISTPVGIAPEIIKEGENGYLFKTQEELSDFLLKLNNNKDLLISIGKLNFKNRDKFSWNNISEIYKGTFIDT